MNEKLNINNFEYGIWKMDRGVLVCSCCNNKKPITGDVIRYCPYCGREMVPEYSPVFWYSFCYVLENKDEYAIMSVVDLLKNQVSTLSNSQLEMYLNAIEDKEDDFDDYAEELFGELKEAILGELEERNI